MGWFTRAPRSRTGVLRQLRKDDGWIDLLGDSSLTVAYTHDELMVTRPGLARTFPLVQVFVIDRPTAREFRLGWSDGPSDYTAYWTPDAPAANATAFMGGLQSAMGRSVRAEGHRLRPSVIRMSMLQLRIAEWEAEHTPVIRLEPSVHPTHSDGRPDWGLEHTRLGYLAYHEKGSFAFSDLMGDDVKTFHKSLVTRLHVEPYPSERLPNVRVVTLTWRQNANEVTAYLHFQDAELRDLLALCGVRATGA
jgi:hypothetical protein